MTPLERLCEKKKVRATVKYGAPENPAFPDSNPYTVTLTYKGRRITTPFYTGRGWDREPGPADVLSSLISDASGVFAASSFEDWASEYGYDLEDPDEYEKIKKVYTKVKTLAPKVERFLGTDFAEFAAAEH